MTDAERIDLACKVLAIANEARVLAMKHDKFHAVDWVALDECARRTKLIGTCDDEARCLRNRSKWIRDRLGVIGRDVYQDALAALFDRAAALHESSPAT